MNIRGSGSGSILCTKWIHNSRPNTSLSDGTVKCDGFPQVHAVIACRGGDVDLESQLTGNSGRDARRICCGNCWVTRDNEREIVWEFNGLKEMRGGVVGAEREIVWEFNGLKEMRGGWR